MDDRIYELYVEICKAIAHPSRMKILNVLREGEQCVCLLAPQVGISESNLSQHLAILRKAGLVEARRDGQSTFYQVRDRRIFAVLAQMGAILADQAARTQDVLGAL